MTVGASSNDILKPSFMCSMLAKAMIVLPASVYVSSPNDIRSSGREGRLRGSSEVELSVGGSKWMFIYPHSVVDHCGFGHLVLCLLTLQSDK